MAVPKGSAGTISAFLARDRLSPRLQGGVKLPTGGMSFLDEPASARSDAGSADPVKGRGRRLQSG